MDDEEKLHPDEIFAEVMLREPYSVNPESGEVTPMVEHMGWSPISVMLPGDCEHGVTICDECGNSWQEDHFIRFSHDGEVFWQSPGTPTE